jgi:hypothetical protein
MSVLFCLFLDSMSSAVKFDDQTGVRTEEVHDIGSDRVLPPELHAIKSPPA